jgi:hypothetical protein
MRTRLALLLLLVFAGAALAQGTFVNWESPPVHPLDMLPSGAALLAVNTADARLDVFALGGPLPVHQTSIPVAAPRPTAAPPCAAGSGRGRAPVGDRL